MDCMKYGQYLEYTSLFADSRDFSVTLPDENCGMNAFDGCLTILEAKIHWFWKHDKRICSGEKLRVKVLARPLQNR